MSLNASGGTNVSDGHSAKDKGHHGEGLDVMNHMIIGHCFGQSLPEGIRGVALICTYRKAVRGVEKGEL